MKRISRIFLQGLAAIVPVVLTVYIIWWIANWAETLSRKALQYVLDEKVMEGEAFFPGMGILLAVGLILFVGLLMDIWVFRRLLSMGELVVLRIPVVKSIYGGIRDLMNFVSSTSEQKEAGQAVMVEVADNVRLIGLVTREDFRELPEGIGDEHTIAVYLPMSYQIGGYTVFIPHDKIKPFGMPRDDAMSFALTAAMSTGGRKRPMGEVGTGPSAGDQQEEKESESGSSQQE